MKLTVLVVRQEQPRVVWKTASCPAQLHEGCVVPIDAVDSKNRCLIRSLAVIGDSTIPEKARPTGADDFFQKAALVLAGEIA